MPPQIKAYGALILVFLVGALAGSLLTRAVFLKRDQDFWGKGPSSVNEFMIRQLVHHLQLNPDQVRGIRRILFQAQQRNHRLLAPLENQLRANWLGARNQLEALLNPDQLNQFENLLDSERRRAKMKKEGSWLLSHFDPPKPVENELRQPGDPDGPDRNPPGGAFPPIEPPPPPGDVAPVVQPYSPGPPPRAGPTMSQPSPTP